MTAQIIPFPPRGPFTVHVEREGAAWLVICRDHGWLHGDRRKAISTPSKSQAGSLLLYGWRHERPSLVRNHPLL